MDTSTLREMPSSLNDACRQMELAADEIERMTERCAAYRGQVEAGSYEIERLRAVLREIAIYGTCTDIDTSAMARKALGVHEQCAPLTESERARLLKNAPG